MPRCCSISIQSDRVARVLARPRTAPAWLMAPDAASSFSVRVVLPASGCEMIAKVRRDWYGISRVAALVSVTAFMALGNILEGSKKKGPASPAGPSPISRSRSALCTEAGAGATTTEAAP
jgi:hypothetical protein